MEIEDVNTVGVIGAGEMGHGIAEASALSGFDTIMRDVEREIVEEGIKRIENSIDKLIEKEKISENDAEKALNRLEATVSMDDLSNADFVIEAVPEKMALKKSVFEELDNITPSHAILATNTSYMSITEIGESTNRPEKVVGMHFFNPVILFDLVEIIKGEKTSGKTMEISCEFTEVLGKDPVRVEKDTPGFIINRVNAPRRLLAAKILEKGDDKPEDVDYVCKEAGLPMGIYELFDYLGLETYIDTSKYLEENLSSDYEPSKQIEEMVENGEYGRKTGKGFYDWSEGRPEINPSKPVDEIEFNISDLIAVQVNEATKLLERGVVENPKDINEAVKRAANFPKGPLEWGKEIGYEKLAKRCEELAKRYDVKVFKPTETLKKGKIDF